MRDDTLEDVKMAIKDCIFESVLLGNDLKTTFVNLLQNGFKKGDILKAYNEMVEEAEKIDH